MPAHNAYFPLRIGDQIVWLKNYRGKIGGYQAPGGYQASDISATVADADYVIVLLETWLKGVTQFAQGATAYTKLVLYGPIATAPVALPLFTGNPPTGSPPPGTIPWPAVVPPGALKRIFAFVANLKTRAFANAAVQQDLDVVGAEVTDDPNAVPPCSAEARSGEVVIRFKKLGHMGVWVEGQVAAETEWTHLAVDTSDPYNDTRPLKVAGQPEKRRYRVCFWDGEPTNVWCAVMEVTFGG
jgi:hypothetical protein